jgi:hypothetical protein
VRLDGRSSRSGRLICGTKGLALAQNISSSSAKDTAVRSTLDAIRNPTYRVDEIFGIPLASLANLPSALHPEGWILGVRRSWFVHWLKHTCCDLRKQEMRISKKTGTWMRLPVRFQPFFNSPGP